MTLSQKQIDTTAAEHRAHIHALGVTPAQVCNDLGWEDRRLADVLVGKAETDPVDSWELRDYLVATARNIGADVAAYSNLTDENRLRAQQWFDLLQPLRHSF